MTDDRSMPPALPAVLRRQAWIDDHAVDVEGGRTPFDAGPALLSLAPREFRRIVIEGRRTSGRDFDRLAEASGLLGGHDGPFEVEMATEGLHAFLTVVGIDWETDITQRKLDLAKAAYARLVANSATTFWAVVDLAPDGTEAGRKRFVGDYAEIDATRWFRALPPSEGCSRVLLDVQDGVARERDRLGPDRAPSTPTP